MSTKPTPFKSIVIVYSCFIVAMVLFSGVSYYIIKDPFFGFNFTEDPLVIVILIAAIAAPMVGQFMYKKKLVEVTSKEDLAGKLGAYQGINIIRLAFAEAVCLLALVLFIKTSNLYYLLVASIMILYCVLIRPTRDKFITEGQLSMSERSQLQ